MSQAHGVQTSVIVVGYDGREESRDALALARLLAPGMAAEVLLVSILVHAPLEIEAPTYEASLREDTERFAAEIREQVGDDPVRVLALPAASAAKTLHDVAERESAALIVLGSTHRGPLGRVLPGSVGERLLAAGPCAVAVAPRGFAAQDDRGARIVGVGWTDTPESRQALDFAVSLVERVASSIRLVSVVGPVSRVALATPNAAAAWASLEYGFEKVEEAAIEERERALAAALESLPAGVDTTGDVLRGDPASRLIDVSADLDLLVLGSRGYGPLRRVLLGSVSAPVMRAAGCPVIVVPRAGSLPEVEGGGLAARVARESGDEGRGGAAA